MALVVALLRGVNVGGNRKLSMAELRATLATAGYGEVRTHLQSGNVILDSAKKPATLERELEQLLRVQIVVRTHDELVDVVARDPFGELASNGSRYFVTFLSGPVTQVAASNRATASCSSSADGRSTRGFPKVSTNRSARSS